MSNRIISLLLVALLAISVGFAYSNQTKAYPNWNNWGDKDTQEEITVPPEQEQEQEQEQEIDLNPESYEEALKMAEENDKKIFLFFTGDYCVWCKKMKSETLSDKEIQNLLSKYIVYHVDVMKEKDVRNKYNIKGIPNYFIIDKDEKVLKSGKGYKGKSSFANWINS